MQTSFLNKFALGVAVLVLGFWGIVLIVHPELVHASFSSEPLNHAQAGMMGAAFLGLALISLVTETGWMSTRRALGVSLAVLVLVALLLMFGPGTIIVTPLTSMSLVATISVVFFLMI